MRTYKKVLTICPSNRPERLKLMLDSFRATAHISDIVVRDEIGSITALINETFKLYPDYEYYHITNDDFIYHTDGWDELLQTDGIAYGDDLMSGGKLPTAPFINGNIARAVGYLQLPTLSHLFGDCVWREIGQRIKGLHYKPDVIIEHQHYMSRKANKSDYLITNSQDMYRRDQQAYREWLRNGAEQDAERAGLALRQMRGPGGIS